VRRFRKSVSGKAFQEKRFRKSVSGKGVSTEGVSVEAFQGSLECKHQGAGIETIFLKRLI
jgi:hypothetical protein